MAPVYYIRPAFYNRSLFICLVIRINVYRASRIIIMMSPPVYGRANSIHFLYAVSGKARR